MTDQQQQQQEETSSSSSSALRDNIERKAKNSYYYAHAHNANGPEWDGKEEPKLLSKTAGLSLNHGDATVTTDNGTTTTTANPHNTTLFRASTTSHSTFDFKSNITSYAFSDDGATVKLYISMEGVGEQCTDDDISLDHTPHSFCLMVHNYSKNVLIAEDAESEPPPPEPLCLSFLKLTAEISKATYKKKKDRVVLILHKTDKETEWHTINDKGMPDP